MPATTFDSRILTESAALIGEEMDKLAKSVVENMMPDYPAYMKKFGEYQGLRNALRFMEEVERAQK